MNDTLQYVTVEDLQRQPLAEIVALWELVPTDRQRRYKAVYDRELRHLGASGSDALERQVVGELLDRYVKTALVPIGARWARCPARIQTAAREDANLIAPEDTAPQPTRRRPLLVLAVAGVVFALFALLAVSRFGGRGNRLANLALTGTLTRTPTPGRSPTPTPIALEEQDPVIRGGDAERAVAYPVNLRVTLADSAPPRIFVVQRRVIQTAEWNFDPNPDTASYIAGLTVRPVIGVPWSPENAELFERIAEGARFTLQMNTGAALSYGFVSKSPVSRSDTGIFRQIGPGLVLALVGERDLDGLPTATRTVITATYTPEQELSRTGALTSLLPTPETTATVTQAPVPFQRLDVQVISVTTVPGRVAVQMRLYNGDMEPMRIGPDDIWMAFGYAPNPPGPRVPAEGLASFDLLPGQAADVTVEWAWAGEPHSILNVWDWKFELRNER